MLLKLFRLALANPLLTLKLLNWRRLKNFAGAIIENRGDANQIYRRYNGIYQAATSAQHAALKQRLKEYHAVKGDILILPIIDWGFRYQRPQHLAAGLAKHGYRVFYVATTPLIGGHDAYRLTESPAPNIYLCQLRGTGTEGQNMHEGDMSPGAQKAFETSIAAMQADLQLQSPIIIVNHPYWQRLAGTLPRSLLIYDCMDHHAGFTDGDSQAEDHSESLLVEEADILAVSSDYLMERFVKRRPDTIMIRNGCNHAFFANTPAAPRAKQKVAGYVGAISSWFDIDLIERTARLLPDWQFILVGATHGCDVSAARKLPNITFVGEVDYNDVPQHIARFDICLIPFKINELTKATNPVKIYEYLAAGRPVVSTPMPEVIKLGDKVFIADGPDAFAAKMEEAYTAGGDTTRLQSWQGWAKGEDWAARSAILATAIADRLERKV